MTFAKIRHNNIAKKDDIMSIDSKCHMELLYNYIGMKPIPITRIQKEMNNEPINDPTKDSPNKPHGQTLALRLPDHWHGGLAFCMFQYCAKRQRE